jgi:tetratricopeptide (TPR) repeat protein
MAKDYIHAIAAYDESLKCLRSVGVAGRDHANVFNWLAVAEYRSGRVDDAQRTWDEAPRIANGGGYGEEIAHITGNLAQIALQRENWSEAEAGAIRALDFSRKLGRQGAAWLIFPQRFDRNA